MPVVRERDGARAVAGEPFRCSGLRPAPPAGEGACADAGSVGMLFVGRECE